MFSPKKGKGLEVARQGSSQTLTLIAYSAVFIIARVLFSHNNHLHLGQYFDVSRSHVNVPSSRGEMHEGSGCNQAIFKLAVWYVVAVDEKGQKKHKIGCLKFFLGVLRSKH